MNIVTDDVVIKDGIISIINDAYVSEDGVLHLLNGDGEEVASMSMGTRNAGRYTFSFSTFFYDIREAFRNLFQR